MAIKKDTLHPEGEPDVDIYPKTSIDQVENLQANLDALNGDIANANGEISTVSNRVNVNEKNITDLQNDVNQNIMDIATAESNIQGLQGSVSTLAEKVDTAETGLVQLTEQVERVGNQTNENTSDISNLNTAYNSYNDYTTVTDGFLLTYASGKQIELPIKAGTNVVFSKYSGTNQIVINAATPSFPISVMYSSSRLGVNSVDFPFNIDKNYFFTITMTNTGESKSFIYAKGINATYTIVINSSTSFEVKLDATGSSTRLIFTNKSNADPFVVRAEISN